MAPLIGSRPRTRSVLKVLAILLASCGNQPASAPAPQVQAVQPPAASKALEPSPREDKHGEPVSAAALPLREGMRLIPKTTFFAGVEPGSDDVQPGHEAHAGPFYIDELEVTVDQYRHCVESQGCPQPTSRERGCNYFQKGREHHPMNCVDWYAADRFCRAQNKRLPGGEEWQLAARGTDRRIYPWGTGGPDGKRCCRSSPRASRASTCEVGTHQPGDSAFGIHDMAGNVAEWTASRAPVAAGTAYDVYGGGYIVEDVETPEWREVRLDLPSSYAPTYTAPDVGFRCVSDPS